MAENNVATTSLSYDSMSKKWELIFDLLGGTQAMRDAGTRWLPKMSGEEQKQYDVRLASSFLFNGYRDAVRKLVSRPFSRAVVLRGDEHIPEHLQVIEDDVDLTGKSLTALGREMMSSALHCGVDHLLIDYFRSNGTESKAKELQIGMRPLLVHVPAQNLIAWRIESDEYGRSKLVQIRILEERIEPDGEYGEIPVKYIRVFNLDSWELWRFSDARSTGQRSSGKTKDWVLVEGGKNSFGRIPLLTWYTYRTGFMTGEPPLDDLAWTNLAHWQSYSDQRSILQFARVGILFGSGITAEDLKRHGGKITIGPNRTIISSDEKANLKYVEHSGAAIGAGRDDLNDLQDRMELLGLMPLVQRTGSVTATERSINEARSSNDLQAWTNELESVLTQAFHYAAKWRAQDLSDEFAVDIFSDWGVGDRNIDEVNVLVQLALSGKMSTTTLLAELKRRGVLDELIDIDLEMERIKDEPVELAAMGLAPDEDDDAED